MDKFIIGFNFVVMVYFAWSLVRDIKASRSASRRMEWAREYLENNPSRLGDLDK